jgi:hypothetical protein
MGCHHAQGFTRVCQRDLLDGSRVSGGLLDVVPIEDARQGAGCVESLDRSAFGGGPAHQDAVAFNGERPHRTDDGGAQARGRGAQQDARRGRIGRQ